MARYCNARFTSAMNLSVMGPPGCPVIVLATRDLPVQMMRGFRILLTRPFANDA